MDRNVMSYGRCCSTGEVPQLNMRWIMTNNQVEPSVKINLTDPDLYAHGDPYAVWRWLREHDPVHWHPPGDLPGFWVLTKYDDVRAVYRDPATFSSARGILLRPETYGDDPGGGRTLALTDPPHHRKLRALVDDWFSPRSIRVLDAEMRDIAHDVVTRVLEHETCDFVTEIAARIPLYVICKMMGVPRNDWEYLFELTNDAFGAGEAAKRRGAHLDILQYFGDMVVTRANSPADDLVSVLATAKIDGRKLTADEIILNCDNLLVGGTENTRIAASGGMLAFLQHPDQWQALSTEPELLHSAVDEVLRWTSTATHIMRTATAPVTIRDRRIEAGERVTLWNPSANRDESVFDDPESFSVRRKPNRHMALGTGEHFCLGGTLGRAELRLLYGELLHATQRIELDGAPVMLSSIIVNGPERLPVKLTPR
jgi:cytochrome P450